MGLVSSSEPHVKCCDLRGTRHAVAGMNRPETCTEGISIGLDQAGLGECQVVKARVPPDGARRMLSAKRLESA